VYIICCTNNFICKITGKQLASYAGVAPFGNTSGTSIKGRDKVHKMANKDLKKLLHMGAISAITHYPEFRDYYERKVKEGKHEQSVINAVRSKIALRAVAVINNQKEYVDSIEKQHKTNMKNSSKTFGGIIAIYSISGCLGPSSKS
jgi:tRNA uridine 5-carbamoylmethylation protein Kti12